MRIKAKQHRLSFILLCIFLFLGFGYALSTSAHRAARAESAVVEAGRAPDIVWQGAHSSLMRAVVFSRNGQQLASGGDDHKSKVWQSSNGTLLQTLTQCAGLRCGSTSYLAFSPDDQTLASDGGGLKLWRIADGALLNTLSFNGGIPVISPDWQYVVTSLDQSTYPGNIPSVVTLFRLSDKSQVWQSSGAGGLEAAFSPDGQIVAAVGRKTGVDFWKVSDGTHLRHIAGPKKLLIFSPDGQYIATTQAATGLYPYDHTIEIYRVSDGALVQTFLGTGAVDAIAWTPNGQTILSTGWEVGNIQYGIIRLWRVSDGTLLKSYDQGIGSYTGAVAVSPDGNLFGYTQSDSSVYVAHMPTQTCNYSIDQRKTTFQHDGGIGTVQITAPAGCSWTAHSNVDWVHITSGSSGAGNGTVTYSVDIGDCYVDNPTGLYRNGILVIAEQTFDVNQNECPLGPGHYRIAGQIQESSPCNYGIAGVTVTLGGAATATTQTDSGGFFAFDNLLGQESYTITPSKSGYSFNPQSVTINKLSYDYATVINATVNPYPRHTIKGYVKDKNGQPVSGAKMNLGGAAWPQAVYSDPSGFYAFTCLEYGGNFTITPEYSGYTFTPSAKAFDNLSNDQSSDFMGIAVPTAAPTTISGQVTTADGVPLSGVVMNLNGQSSARTITDSNGNYRFDNLETGGFYTLTPLRANYAFNPATRSFSIGDNKTDAGFMAAATATTANPLDTDLFFVRQHYLDFLSREPDAGGLDYWASQFAVCNGDALCLRQTSINVSAAFFVENEFQQTGSFVYRLYKGALGRQVDYAEFSTDRQQVVGGANLDASKAAFADAFVQRQEFMQKYQLATTAESFVDSLIQTMQQASGVDLSTQRSTLLARYNAGSTLNESRSLALREAIETTDFKQAEYNRSFVLMQYFGYLKRNPDQSGFEFWLNVLNNREPNNYRGMVCSFITSSEYQQRFSPVATHSNRECGP